MKILEEKIADIYRCLEILQNIKDNPLIPQPIVTEQKLGCLVDGFEKSFRKHLLIGEIPAWAEKLHDYLIDWHELIAAEDEEVIESVLNDSDYETLYLNKNGKRVTEFAEHLIHDSLFLKRLEMIARILSAMAESGLHIIRIQANWFSFYNDRIYARWNSLEKNTIKSDQNMIEAYELGWMHPGLRKREIPKNYPLIAAVNHTFAYLILYTLTELPPPHSAIDFQIQIDRFRAYNPSLSPFFRKFFRNWLSGEISNSKTPLDCYRDFEIITTEINVRRQMTYQKGHIEYQGDSVFGRNKQNNENEDNIIVLKGLPLTHALVGVSDGVSTATLGSGWLAGAMIKKMFQIHEEEWCKAVMALPETQSEPEKWKTSAVAFLNHVFETVHLAVVEEINHFAKIRNADAIHSEAPMSSTLTLALLEGNRCVIAHWGDSRIYLVNHHGLTRLTEDHNQQLNELVQSRKSGKPFRSQREGSLHLTRTIGACSINQKTKSYSAIPVDKQPVAINTVFLKDGEFVLICSDGLLSGLSIDSEAGKEEKIMPVFKEYKEKGCREIAFHLVRNSDDDRGDDNITAMVLRYNSNKPAAPKN